MCFINSVRSQGVGSPEVTQLLGYLQELRTLVASHSTPATTDPEACGRTKRTRKTDICAAGPSLPARQSRKSRRFGDFVFVGLLALL